MDPITENLIKQLHERRGRGIKKYGATTDKFDLGTLGWLQHLQEELLDGAVYIERLKMDLKKETK